VAPWAVFTGQLRAGRTAGDPRNVHEMSLLSEYRNIFDGELNRTSED